MENSPLTVARFANMSKLKVADDKSREFRARKRIVRKRGYRGPLTREELARTVN